jgi:membrane-bound metal-dependent hydrolase YbcI (DUF457 family)
MFPGHFAAGLMIKAVEPRAPTLGLMLGVGVLDLVFGVGVALGIEGGGFSHFITPWSHSLLMALAWSILYAACFYRGGRGVAMAMFAAVLSHWVLDLVSHAPDMQLWPHSTVELGYGHLFGGLGGWLEAGVSAAGVLAYIRYARRPEFAGRKWSVVASVIAICYGLEVLVVP